MRNVIKVIFVIGAFLIHGTILFANLEPNIPILVDAFSLNISGGGTYYSQDPPYAEFILKWRENSGSDYITMGGGLGIHWYHGDIGHYDFTADNNSDFADIVAGFTNDQDDTIGASVTINGGGLLGSLSPESGRFHWPNHPDMAGQNIDFIRLVVNDVSLIHADNYVDEDISVTWQFWSVPEPSTICLLGIGGMILRKRKANKS